MGGSNGRHPPPVFWLCFSVTVLFCVVAQALHHVEAIAANMEKRRVVHVGCAFAFVEAIACLVPWL